MSLTIPPQALAAGFNPKRYPIIAPPKEAPPDSGVSTHSTNVDVKVDLSHLEIIKIIPEGGTDGDNDFYSDRGLVNNKTAFRVNPDSYKLAVELTDPDAGEEVRQTSDKN